MQSPKINSSNSENTEEDKKRDTETFDLNDKVDYNDFVQNLPDEIIFPEELNRFLRDQIRELTAENGCLRRSLEECEEKLKDEIKNNSQTDQSTFSKPVGRANELAATKIVELSKKCRDQRAEIEVLKSKCKILESKSSEINKIEETKISSCLDSGDGLNSRPFTIEEELKNRDEENKVLQEKLNHVNSKLYDSKNTCTSLRQELNKALKLLSREIGENVTTASLTSKQIGGWKGRSELIQQLQNKLSEYEGNCGKLSNVSISDKRNIENLRKIEKERRQKAEDLAKELRDVTAALESSKRKQDAAKARIKVLENDLNHAKQSVALLNEKRSHDEQLIQALNGRLKTLEEKYRDKENEILNVKEKSENDCMKMCCELNRLRSMNDNYVRIMEERETEIDTLKQGLTSSSSARGNDTRCCSSISRIVDHRLKTLQQSQSSNHNAGGIFVNSTRISNSDQNEYVTIGVAAEAERERLMELVIVLNRRIEEERFAADKMNETLRLERNKSARLETKLQRLEMEKVGMTKSTNAGYKLRSSKSSSISISGAEAEILKDETKFRLELLEEECLALKTRLATVQRDKATDLAVYKQMLDQARKTFQDAYRGKPGSCNYSTVTI